MVNTKISNVVNKLIKLGHSLHLILALRFFFLAAKGLTTFFQNP